MKQPGLSNEEIEACRTAFAMFDKDFSGSIDSGELRETLKAMGQNPSDEELFLMISQVDDNGSGTIEFSEFMQLILSQKVQQEHEDNESDTIDAFVALGGNPDKTGVIKCDKLSHVIKDFELLIDIDYLLAKADTDGSGFIDYDEFKELLAISVIDTAVEC